ncbi:MAG: hypothetical protein JNK74_25670 [Candidatus Hydrogenedentes bacterium]|nr:hypothetical protein [Candidatus Hydrogenedentota bacterium]
MMTLLGWLLLLVAILAPLALANAGVPSWVWIATGVVGALLIMLNRRPNN